MGHLPAWSKRLSHRHVTRWINARKQGAPNTSPPALLHPKSDKNYSFVKECLVSFRYLNGSSRIHTHFFVAVPTIIDRKTGFGDQGCYLIQVYQMGSCMEQQNICLAKIETPAKCDSFLKSSLKSSTTNHLKGKMPLSTIAALALAPA